MPKSILDTNNKEDKIVSEWYDFMNSGMKKEFFKDDIYAHLVLHGGFKFKEDKSDFYDFYFAECNKAHRLYPKIKYKRTCHILEHHFNAKEGKSFLNNLFSEWNQYGSYANLNKEIQLIYIQYMKKTAEFLENFIREANDKKET